VLLSFYIYHSGYDVDDHVVKKHTWTILAQHCQLHNSNSSKANQGPCRRALQGDAADQGGGSLGMSYNTLLEAFVCCRGRRGRRPAAQSVFSKAQEEAAR